MSKHNLLDTLKITSTVIFGVGIVASPSQAAVMTSGCAAVNQFCTLQELFDGGTIQSADKLFSNWSLFVDLSSPFLVNYSNIQVSGLDTPAYNPGLRFMSMNNELMANPNQNFQFLYDFKVTSLGNAIKDFSLKLIDWDIDSITLPDSSFINTGKFLTKTQGGFENLGNPFVESDGSIFDSGEIVGEPVQMLWVREVVNVVGRDTGSANLRKWEQRFSQVVPEPTSIISLLAFATLITISTIKHKLKP